MRYVVGVELAIPVVDRLSLLQEEAETQIFEAGARVRWTPVEHIRLNLKVFKNLESGAVQRVQEMLEDFAKAVPAFPFQTLGTSADRRAGQAKLLTTRVEEPEGILTSLAEHIDRAADRIGFDGDDRPWHPHVLLGRLATPSTAVDFEPILAPYAQTVWGETQCRELVLYRSQLVGRESRVRVLRRFALGTGR